MDRNQPDMMKEAYRKRALRAGRRHASPITINIRCDGKMHKLGLEPRGRVVFYDHDRQNLASMRLLRKMGHEGCACISMAERLKRRHGFPADRMREWTSMIRDLEATRAERDQRPGPQPRFVTPLEEGEGLTALEVLAERWKSDTHGRELKLLNDVATHETLLEELIEGVRGDYNSWVSVHIVREPRSVGCGATMYPSETTNRARFGSWVVRAWVSITTTALVLHSRGLSSCWVQIPGFQGEHRVPILSLTEDASSTSKRAVVAMPKLDFNNRLPDGTPRFDLCATEVPIKRVVEELAGLGVTASPHWRVVQ